eukprot:712355_1
MFIHCLYKGIMDKTIKSITNVQRDVKKIIKSDEKKVKKKPTIHISRTNQKKETEKKDTRRKKQKKRPGDEHMKLGQNNTKISLRNEYKWMLSGGWDKDMHLQS